MFALAFFFVEETSYDRNAHVLNGISTSGSNGSGDQEKTDSTTIEQLPVIPDRKSFAETLRPWSGVDHRVAFFAMMWRSFTYFLVPQVLWVITTFGINIGLGALTFNYVFPIKITSAPYNWPVVSHVVQPVSILSLVSTNNGGNTRKILASAPSARSSATSWRSR